MFGVKIFVRKYKLPDGRHAVASWFTVDMDFPTADDAAKWAVGTGCKLYDIRIFKREG